MKYQKTHSAAYFAEFVIHSKTYSFFNFVTVADRAAKQRKKNKKKRCGKTSIKGKTYYWHLRRVDESLPCDCKA